jgi:hypothetical protein
VRTQTEARDPLFSDYHNYALEFLSDRIIFYFDKKPYAWFMNPDCPEPDVNRVTHALNMYPMYVIFGNGIDHIPGCTLPNNPNGCSDAFNYFNMVPWYLLIPQYGEVPKPQCLPIISITGN